MHSFHINLEQGKGWIWDSSCSTLCMFCIFLWAQANLRLSLMTHPERRKEKYCNESTFSRQGFCSPWKRYKWKEMLEMLNVPVDLASTGIAMVTYASICHGVNIVKVEELPSRGAECLHCTKNDKWHKLSLQNYSAVSESVSMPEILLSLFGLTVIYSAFQCQLM